MITHKFFIKTLVIIFSASVQAQSEQLPFVDCFDSIESEYTYSTEVLMHKNDRGQITVKDFEQLRLKLILQREKEHALCQAVLFSEESLVPTTTIVSATRTPASLSIDPADDDSCDKAHSESQPGAPALTLSQEPMAAELQDVEAAYSGERVSIGN